MCAAENATGQLRAVAERLGLPLRQFVALMGAHKLGRWWRDVQPPYFHQFYAPGPLKFDNSYFKCAPPTPSSTGFRGISKCCRAWSLHVCLDFCKRPCGSCDFPLDGPHQLCGPQLTESLQLSKVCVSDARYTFIKHVPHHEFIW